MRQMKISREIKIQRLQTKNRMTGQTFNPTGHTAESLDKRERELVEKCNAMSKEERQEMYNNYNAIEQWKDENNYHFSNDFEHNAFMRNFKYQFQNQSHENKN